MNCRKAKKVIFEYMDGLTDESLRLDLERHLGECRECETLATSLRDSLDLLHRAPQEKLDENFNWKVRLAIHRERGALQDRTASQGAFFGAWNFRYAASAAAGFVTILAGGWLAINLALSPASQESPVLPATEMTTRTTTQPAETTPLPMVRPGMQNNRGSLVTQGNSPFGRDATPRAGAIDMVSQPAQFDSLLHVRLHSEMMSIEESRRAEYLQRVEAAIKKCEHDCGGNKQE